MGLLTMRASRAKPSLPTSPSVRHRSSLPGDRRLFACGRDSHGRGKRTAAVTAVSERAPHLSPGLNGSGLNGTLGRDSAGHRRIFSTLNIYISVTYNMLIINYLRLDRWRCCPLFVVDRGYENGLDVVVAGVIPGGRLRRGSLDGDARCLAGR